MDSFLSQDVFPSRTLIFLFKIYFCHFFIIFLLYLETQLDILRESSEILN